MKETSYIKLKEFELKHGDLHTAMPSILQGIQLIIKCYKNGGKILTCGNGGSCSDAEHIVGELMKGFLLKRPINAEIRSKIESVCTTTEESNYLCDHLQGALPAIALGSHTALNSAFVNDVAADMVFAQQVLGYGNPNDILIGLSTSGNSLNVVNAMKIAKALGITTIGLTGQNSSKISTLSSLTIHAPSTETYEIQEYHLKIYHLICAIVENELF